MSKIILSVGLAVTTLVIGVQSANAQSNIAVSGITNVGFKDFSFAAGADSKAEANGALGSSVTATAGITNNNLFQATATTTATGTTTGSSPAPNPITTSFINGNTAASGQVGFNTGFSIGAGANANGNSQIKSPAAATASLQTTSKIGSFGNAFGGVADVGGSASDGVNIANGKSNAGAAVLFDLTDGFISGSGSATSNLNTVGSPNTAGGTGALFASPSNIVNGFFNVNGSATGAFTTAGFSFR
jgi:hypothetical protein